MKNKHSLMVSILATLLTIALMCYLPLYLLKQNPSAGLAAIGIVAPFYYFPYNQFTALFFVCILTPILYFLYKRFKKDAVIKFWKTLIFTIIIVQGLVFFYNYNTNFSGWQKLQQIDTANSDKKAALKILHETFADIMKTRASDRCHELGQLLQQKRDLFVTRDEYSEARRYSLYTEERCQKILEGDYEYFTKDQEGISVRQAVFPFFDTWSQAGWLAIFNIFGYEHCLKQDTSLVTYPEQSNDPRYSNPIPISRFCTVKQAIASKDSNYCEHLTRDLVSLNYNYCISQLASLTKQPKLCEQLSLENKRKELEALRSEFPGSSDKQFNEFVESSLQASIESCKKPGLREWNFDQYRITPTDYVKHAETIDVEYYSDEYNAMMQTLESEKKATEEKKLRLAVLHTTFGEIMKNKQINRCAELEKLMQDKAPLIENKDYYILYTEENCKKILQGDYAFFSKLALEKDEFKKEKESFPFMLEARESAWLTIFNAFGYEHCIKSSQFSIAPTRTFEPPDGSYFGQLEKKQIPFSNFCNLKQAITTKDLAYCDQMKGDDFFSRDSCIRELPFVKQEPTLCDSGLEGTRRALDANRKNVPWTYDDEYQEHIVYFMNKIVAECKNPWLPLRAYAVTSDNYAEKFSILAEDVFYADPWEPGFKGFD